MTSHIKEKQTRYLSQAIQLEESSDQNMVRVTMLIISLAIISFIVWAAFTNINEVARTPGEVVPQGFSQVVQHLEGGIVEKIEVREGQMVEARQVLLRIDGGGAREDLVRALNKQAELEMQEERLRAYLQSREPDFSRFEAAYPDMVRDKKMFFASMIRSRDQEEKIVQEQIAQKKSAIDTLNGEMRTAQGNYAITQDLYNRRRELNRKGYASDIQFLETKQRLNDIGGEIARIKNRITVTRAEIGEYENRLASLGAGHHDDASSQLDRILAEKLQNEEVTQKLRSRVDRLEVRAPVRGMVKGLSVNTIGAVVQPGQVLMEVVPRDEKLVVEIRVPPQHIGHLKTGQAVQVKFSSFDFSRYGSVPGALEYLSATTFTGTQGERYYKGRVLLQRNYVGANPHNLVMPGMTVMADIITGEKTILAYLLKPVNTVFNTAFTER